MVSNSRVLVTVITLCFEAKDFKLLNEHIVLLSKKHGLLKQAVVKMVQQAMTFMDQTPDLKTKLELIDTLRTVTEGKVGHLFPRIAAGAFRIASTSESVSLLNLLLNI